MARTEAQTEKTQKSSFPNLTPPEFAAMGKKRLEELVAIQTKQLEKLQEVNQHWFDRMQSEAALASEFTAKLTAARSMPEVVAAYQEWARLHMAMAAEDAKRILADGQQAAKAGARLFANGWKPNDLDVGST